MIRALIADDHAVFRRGVKDILKDSFPSISFGEAKTAQEVLDSVRKHPWEVIILDISMPGKSGLDILEDLKQLKPLLPTLVLSMHPEEQFARRALKAGAAGYLTKDSVPEELCTAVKRLIHGGRYVSTKLAERLVEDLRDDSDRPAHELFSEREFQVLRLMASGKTVKQVADEIHLSVKTVSTYRARILVKTALKTTADLIRYALRNNLVE